MTKNSTVRKSLLAGILLLALGPAASAQDLRLAAPADMTDSGFLEHLLPRFKLKHRISATPVDPQAEADLALESGAGQGDRVFADTAGTTYRLRLIATTPETEKFRGWLQSDPGRAAVTSFPRGGPPAYTTNFAQDVVVEAPEVTGDATLGADLALTHCGRCHVVDKRNRMGGIGSSPSFAAMRARPHWFDLFSAYWAENPHPSFTEVIGVTEPFSETNVTHVAPMQITLDEIDAIVAFVETLEPLDLGKPVQFD